MRKYLFFLGALLMIAPAISEARVYCKSTNTGRFCSGLSTDTKPTVAETNDEFWETDTKDLYKYAGAAWSLYINNSSTSGDAGSSSTSPAYVESVFTEQVDTVSAVTVNGTSTEVVSGECGAYECSRMFCALRNDDTANDRTIDAWAFRFAPKNLTASNMPAGYTQTSFSAPRGRLLEAYTGTSSATDTSPDTTLNELSYLMVSFDMLGVGNYQIAATASGAGATVTGYCKKSR